MALILLTRRNDGVHAQGDLEHVRRADPWLHAGQSVRHSLEAGWRWAEGQLELFADRLGFMPIFYCVEDERISISDSLAALLAAQPSAQWDFDALSVFLRLGFFLGDDTPFETIRVLPPATRTVITRESFELPRVRTLPDRTKSTIDRADARERYIRLFEEAVSSRSTFERVALPLSGGRDSRHILFALVRSGRKPDLAVTYTRGGLADPEYRVAIRLCSELGIPHVTAVDRAESGIARESDKNRLTHYLTDEHSWYLDVVSVLKSHGVDMIFDGIGGDVLSNGLLYDEQLLSAFEANRPDRVAALLIGENGFLHLPTSWRERLSAERARARVEREASLHVRQPNPLSSFYFWNRTRREIALAPLCIASDFQVATPYLEPALLDFLLSLPASGYGAPGFHDEAIRHAFPMYAHLPYGSAKQSGAASRPQSTWREQRDCLSCCAQAARRGLVRSRFAVPRLLRVLFTRDLTPDKWWLNQLAYLVGLSALHE